MCLGLLAWQQGDPDRATSLLEQSLAMYQELGDKLRIATTLLNLAGVIGEYRGDTDRAIALYEDCLPIYRALGATSGIGLVLGNLGEIAALRGDYVQAVALTEEAISLRPEGRAYGLSLLGEVALRQGNTTQASTLQAESLTIRRNDGNHPAIAQSLERLAALAVATGRHQTAAVLIASATAERLESNAPASPAERAEIERLTEAVRGHLGLPMFAAAWAIGQARPLDQVVRDGLALAATIANQPQSSDLGQTATPELDLKHLAVVGPKLSRRERQVLELLVQRWTDPEIAERLYLSPRTVNGHVQGIFNKLGVSNRREAAATAVRLGLI
jgi:ATP/maltotriose-dependent transcriptional regulator MalT